ncbi:SAM-dependent methyltransferase [Streptomonospora alba]|uniref:SAM-dependent methyltransferase n=1 Tax=Streptomonospora alba TaxID=183763 RepID=A0A0C2GAC4_9ACTN|nr:class I SAM-dependent RNA methyltransferase [Streptomonospora alba]KII00349.1 SAM-dependent methyltransferase [Streptomonospora alba]
MGDAAAGFVGTEMELRMEGVAHGGWCVGRHNERVVFVRHTLPGELVRARVTEETARFLRADAVEVLEASPDRVEAPCPFAGPGKCGGCDWQHASLEAQRRLKGQVVSEQLRRIAKIDREVEVEELPGAPDGLGWRTRVRFAVDDSGRAGLRRHRSHEIEPIDHCRIAHPRVDELGVTELDWPRMRDVEAVASSTTRDTALVVNPDGAKLPPLPEPKASSAVMRRFSNGRVQQVRGRRHVREQVGEREFRVSAGGFWQVHSSAAQVLSEAVVEALAPEPGETGLDLFCGSGLFTAGLAEAVGPEGRMLGVENDAEAVRDARYNLRDLPWVRFAHADTDAQLREWVDMRVDFAVLDPPRTGAGTVVARQLSELRNRRVAYVSCDPATLARDLAAFIEEGYELTQLRAFDSFPMTHHVECLAVLHRD